MLLQELSEHQLQLVEILTPCHPRSLPGLRKYQGSYRSKLCCIKRFVLWDMLEDQCGMFGIPYEPAPPPDHWLEHEEETLLQGCCLHTPGHTPGSMSFLKKSY